MPLGCNRLLTSLLTLRLGFGLGVFSRRQLERVVSNTARSGHLWSEWIRMWMLSLSGAPEGGASATLPKSHQLAAKSAARIKLPAPEILKRRHGWRISARMGALQFAPAGFAEIPQRIHLVDKLWEVKECPVRRKVRVDNQPTRLLRRTNDGVGRKNFLSSDESVQANQFRNL
jgi:hypothetical protein